MKNNQGFITTPIIIAIVTILAIGGGVAYIATRPAQDDYSDLGQLETEQVQMNTQVQNTNNQTPQTQQAQPVTGGAQQPAGAGGATSWTDPIGCISMTSPLPNSQVSLPFVIQGTINTLGCWAPQEGEMGIFSIIKNGQVITQQSTDYLIFAQSMYYQSSDYPVPFSATVSSLPATATGSVVLRINEKGPFGEDGMPPMRLPKILDIPIVIN